jgi:predicted Rossmann fold nucleotide-binding protein DprA/Smf involved in DNA uptake
LIQQGAAIVTGVEDILHVLAVPLQFTLNKYQRDSPQESSTPSDHSSDNALLQYIKPDSTSLDEIIQASGLTSAEVSAMLLALEVDGVVAATDDGGFCRMN